MVNFKKVVSPGGKGYLVFSSKSMPQSSQGKIETLGNNRYRLFLEGGGNEIIIKFEG